MFLGINAPYRYGTICSRILVAATMIRFRAYFYIGDLVCGQVGVCDAVHQSVGYGHSERRIATLHRLVFMVPHCPLILSSLYLYINFLLLIPTPNRSSRLVPNLLDNNIFHTLIHFSFHRAGGCARAVHCRETSGEYRGAQLAQVTDGCQLFHSIDSIAIHDC